MTIRPINISTLLFAGLLSLWGCSSSADPDEPGDAIEFSAPVVLGDAVDGGSSRAQMLNELPVGEVFGVSGYCVPLRADAESGDKVADYLSGSALWNDKKQNAVADVMLMQPMKFDGTKCVYRDADDNYYPPARWYTTDATSGVATDRFAYTFIACHPYDGGYFSFPEEGSAGAPQILFTMPFEAGGAADDLLDPSVVSDAMFAVTFNHVRALGAVPLRFTHMLCGLRFQVNNFNTAEPLTIHSIRLSGSFYRSGVIDFSPETPEFTVNPDDTYTGSFLIAGADIEFIPNHSAIVGADGENPAGTSVLLLPEFESASSDSYLGLSKVLTVDYTFQGERRSKQIDPFTIGRRPQQGTLYTVNLNFTGRQLSVSMNYDSNDYWELDPDYDGNNTIN